jgi:hypothetical protein
MKIKVNQKIKDAEGNEITLQGKPAMTLRDVIVNSILTPDQGDDEKKKWEKYEIFKKIKESKNEVELTIEEIALVKQCIGKFQPPLVMGQCWEMLENKT